MSSGEGAALYDAFDVLSGPDKKPEAYVTILRGCKSKNESVRALALQFLIQCFKFFSEDKLGLEALDFVTELCGDSLEKNRVAGLGHFGGIAKSVPTACGLVAPRLLVFIDKVKSDAETNTFTRSLGQCLIAGAGPTSAAVLTCYEGGSPRARALVLHFLKDRFATAPSSSQRVVFGSEAEQLAFLSAVFKAMEGSSPSECVTLIQIADALPRQGSEPLGKATLLTSLMALLNQLHDLKGENAGEDSVARVIFVSDIAVPLLCEGLESSAEALSVGLMASLASVLFPRSSKFLDEATSLRLVRHLADLSLIATNTAEVESLLKPVFMALLECVPRGVGTSEDGAAAMETADAVSTQVENYSLMEALCLTFLSLGSKCPDVAAQLLSSSEDECRQLAAYSETVKELHDKLALLAGQKGGAARNKSDHMAVLLGWRVTGNIIGVLRNLCASPPVFSSGSINRSWRKAAPAASAADGASGSSGGGQQGKKRRREGDEGDAPDATVEASSKRTRGGGPRVWNRGGGGRGWEKERR